MGNCVAGGALPSCPLRQDLDDKRERLVPGQVLRWWMKAAIWPDCRRAEGN